MTPRTNQFSREDIVDAAFALVREHGWGGFSVQAIARAINGSTMPIYSHFANVRDLEDAICLKALEVLKGWMLEVRTGDVWIDHAINWVKFAEEERQLHQILWDGRNVDLCMKCGEDINNFVATKLAGYALFADLSSELVAEIRISRLLFAQKLAFWLNKDPNYLISKGITCGTEEYIRRASMAIYEGFRMQFREEKAGTGNESGRSSRTS